MDLTVTTSTLASAAGEVARLLPSRATSPVLAGVLLTADAHGVVLAGSDHEHALRLARPAVVHGEGAALVAAKPLAETLRALDAEQVRVTAEDSRLVIRAPGARFALPLLEIEAHPGVPSLPPLAGTARAGALRFALTSVAQAASREDALPIFTGIRMTGDGSQLSLLATDRYRMALATLPWESAGTGVDLLAPAAALSELAKQLGSADSVSLHASVDRVGLSWGADAFSTALLAAPFPDDRARELLRANASGTIELEADVLAAALRRASPYGGPRGTVELTAWEGAVRVHSSDPHTGESEESVKATVTGHHEALLYQARFLLDALRPFTGRTVRLATQEGLRPTTFTAPADESGVELTYLVVPMRPA